jgi:hypothetical protein
MSAVRTAFKNLILARSKADIQELLAKVVEAFNHSHGGRELDASDCNDLFNPILKGRFEFDLTLQSSPPVFLGTADEAHEILCTALVLQKLGMERGENGLPMGWSALNRDAKGWVISLLTCSVPQSCPESILRSLFDAKGVVAEIVKTRLPMEPRAEISARRSKILDHSIDT